MHENQKQDGDILMTNLAARYMFESYRSLIYVMASFDMICQDETWEFIFAVDCTIAERTGNEAQEEL